jgi:hypothetical protein
VIFPALACQLRVEARRVPLAANAGGDIHDALITPFGVRLLIGDVMGSGLPASETGAQVLAAWRELAMAESSLPGIAVRLHTLISRSEHPERFVTALLTGFGCGGADMVCCGHPPPLLLRGGTASYVETFPAPPLGLLDLADGWCKKFTVPFGSGSPRRATPRAHIFRSPKAPSRRCEPIRRREPRWRRRAIRTACSTACWTACAHTSQAGRATTS